MSGYSQADDRRRSEASGFAHHLVKPLEIDALLEVLDKLVPDNSRHISRLSRNGANSERVANRECSDSIYLLSRNWGGWTRTSHFLINSQNPLNSDSLPTYSNNLILPSESIA